MSALLFLLASLGASTPDGVGDCVDLPTYGVAEYHGATNLWTIDGIVYGASITEDSCIRPVVAS